jgi:putative FmdB family regulatory protein
MPTYDYRCDGCGHSFEEFQSFSEEPLKKCPACGKKKLVRLFGTGAGVIFKGSGFYETDYRSDSYKQAAKAEQESSAPKTEPKVEAKSDSKTDTNGTAGAKNGSAGTTKAKAGGKSPKSATRATDD